LILLTYPFYFTLCLAFNRIEVEKLQKFKEHGLIKKGKDHMIAYLITFAVILLILYSAVRIHMSLGFNRPAKKENFDEMPRQPHLDEVLFSN